MKTAEFVHCPLRVPRGHEGEFDGGDFGWLTVMVPVWPELGIAVPFAATTITDVTWTNVDEGEASGEILTVAVANGPTLITF